MKTLTILKRMRKLLKAGWTQRVNARNRRGVKVDIMSKSACRFCLNGAYRRITNGLLLTESYGARMFILDAIDSSSLPNRGMIEFNDLSTKAKVLALVDKAIELAKKKQI